MPHKMNIYNEKSKTGELWTRYQDGTILNCVSSLESIFLKYQPINLNFYNEVINNQIKRFDVFYDSIFLETQTGFIFEKIVYDNDNITLYQNINNLTLNGYVPIDYWFDELNFKVYSVNIRAGIQVEDIFDFYLILTEFDCKTGLLNIIYKHRIKLNFYNSVSWGSNTVGVPSSDIPIIETPKICYNKYTKIYNVSFIIRNNNINKMGLISINISKDEFFKTNSINGVVPFCDYCSLISDQNLI